MAGQLILLDFIIFVDTLIVIEWDEGKRLSNIEKHGVDFVALEDFDWSMALLMADDRKDYGERRFIAMLFLDERLHVVIYAERGQVRRIISARKANVREARFYEKEVDSSH